MSDLISRQAAIDLIENRLRKLTPSNFGTVTFRDGLADGYARVISDLKMLPSAEPEQRWIPMTEKWPDPWQQCWFTNRDGEIEQHHFDGAGPRYKAWMPFVEPKPYEYPPKDFMNPPEGSEE